MKSLKNHKWLSTYTVASLFYFINNFLIKNLSEFKTLAREAF
jgi:hypothetical protein